MGLTTEPEHPGSRNMQWRGEYRAKRYMEMLTVEELNRRAADLMTNILALTPGGQIGCLDIANGQSEQWLQRWTHVLEEFQARFGAYPNGFSKETGAAVQLPKATFPEVPPAYRALSTANLQEGTFLLRFGKASHMEAMLHTGNVRITPASSYKDPSLNAAVHDDELSFESVAQPGFAVHVSTSPQGPFVPVGGLRSLREKVEMQSDYFVYCMTHAAAYRLFDDFGYDACVVMTWPREFGQRLIAAVNTTLPEWQVGFGRVQYEDPHFVSARDLRIPLTKHFRYAYQQEYRVFWVPPETRKDLSPFFVELGSIEDCANLIILPQRRAKTAGA